MPKHVKTSRQLAKNTYLTTPTGVGSLLDKPVFHPFFAHLLSQNGSFSSVFLFFHSPKCITSSSKQVKNSCLSILSGVGSTLETLIFLCPRDPGEPTVGTPRARARLPSGPSKGTLVRSSRPLAGQTSDLEPQQVGGSVWTTYPRNLFWSHLAQDMARSWFHRHLLLRSRNWTGSLEWNLAFWGRWTAMIGPPMIRCWGRSALLSKSCGPMTIRSLRCSAFPSTNCQPMMIGSIRTLNRVRDSVVVPRVASEILVFLGIEPLCV